MTNEQAERLIEELERIGNALEALSDLAMTGDQVLSQKSEGAITANIPLLVREAAVNLRLISKA